MRFSISFSFCILLISNSCFAANKGAAPWVGESLEGFQCRGKRQGYGPHDYSEPEKYQLVVGSHFTAKVKNLIGGQRGYLHGDIDYTLRAIPNHHEALLTVIRYEIRRKNKFIKQKLHSPPECYLQRAINFNKKDSAPYSLYAYYLRKMGKLKAAVKQYKKALEISPDSAKIEYSYSLLLIELKQYDKALEHAQKSYQLGNPPPNLKNKLIKIGVWK